MTILVAAETLLLIVLLALVAGLLRSHAEILRRLGPPAEESGDASAVPEPPDRAPADVAPDVAGATLEGDAVKLSLAPGAPSTLLAFLGSGCQSCGALWEALGDAPDVAGAARVVVVTKDTSHESPSRLSELAPAGVPLVMSSAAWADYRVPGSPYFVLVDGPSGLVRGEGAATGWDQIAALIRDAQHDAATGARTSSARAARAEQALSASGIGPGHPSLYPGEKQDP
jgi:hypothetical protein